MAISWPFRRLSRVVDAEPLPTPASSAASLAFRAILREPRLLHRLPRPQARRLAEQADAFAAALMRSDPTVAEWGMLRERAQHVTRAARRWLTLDDMRGESPDAMLLSARAGAGGFGQCLHALQRDAPEVNDSVGALALAAVLELAPVGLPRLGPAQCSVLMLAASRQAAGFLRGERGMPHARPGGEAAAVGEALQVVDRVHAEQRTLPFEAPLARAAAIRAEQAVGLWRDAATCAARFAPTDSARRWNNGRDIHAFAAILALPRVLRTLAPEERDRVSEDAARVASRLLEAAPRDARDLRPAAEAVLAVTGS